MTSNNYVMIAGILGGILMAVMSYIGNKEDEENKEKNSKCEVSEE